MHSALKINCLRGFFMNLDRREDPFRPIPEVIQAIRRGELVVVTDDERRENEGDLICAADRITPEVVNFMARYGRGLICIAMAGSLIERFGLARMPQAGGRADFNTAFLESVDAADGITTGISAYDRARTIQVLMDDRSTEKDIVRPGHIFPLESEEGGVLQRPGHTEAAVDLARFAGLKPAGVICEIIRDDGRMARLPDLLDFSKRHGLMMSSVSDLIGYARAQAGKRTGHTARADSGNAVGESEYACSRGHAR